MHDDLASAKLNYLLANTLICGPVSAILWWRYIEYLPQFKLPGLDLLTAYPWHDFLSDNGTFFGLVCLLIAGRYSKISYQRLRRISKEYDVNRLGSFILFFGGMGFLISTFLIHLLVLAAADNAFLGLYDISKDFSRTGVQGWALFHPYAPGWFLMFVSLPVFMERK